MWQPDTAVLYSEACMRWVECYLIIGIKYNTCGSYP